MRRQTLQCIQKHASSAVFEIYLGVVRALKNLVIKYIFDSNNKRDKLKEVTKQALYKIPPNMSFSQFLQCFDLAATSI